MNRKNIPILIGISLPILFILIISAIIYLPSLSIKPQYNFVYTMEERYDWADNISMYTYDVVEGKIVAKKRMIREFEDNIPLIKPENQTLSEEKPTLYVYDVKLNTSREISFDDAQRLSIDPGPASLDGYTVGYKYGHNGVFELFGSGGAMDGYIITKGKASKKLTGLINLENYLYDKEFQFIGWIK